MKRQKFNKLILAILPFAFCFLSFSSGAQTLAPNAPGNDAQWATAGKQGVGTSASLESKVWFTLAQGVMTEVYYPDVTVANVHLLQFVVVNPKTRKVETEQDDAMHQVEVTNTNSLSFRQINTAKSGEWKIVKNYSTDPKQNTVLINIALETKNKLLELYVYFDSSIGNSGMHDSAWTQNGVLIASEGDKFSALYSKEGFSETTNGFLGINDGLKQLKQGGKLTNYDRAENGNVIQVAKLKPSGIKPAGIKSLDSKIKNKDEFVNVYYLSLGFGKNLDEAINSAKTSTNQSFATVLEEYEKGWADYVKTLPRVEPKYQAQLNMAAMILKAHEDKTVRGANIASLSIPWGGDKNANENTVGGYHLVWSRDLYQVATAFIALGDKDAAIRALNFLFKVQQKADGSFPQNSFLDGKPFWGSLQLDEVAYPLILAYQLQQFDKATYENHVKRAADFLVKTGPKTPQERWEEKSGYSPSTIAAEIAGLVCAAHIARINGDETSANLYLKTADEWAANVEKWTATTNGKYGDGNYYIRLTENGKPDAKEPTVLNNGAGTFIENEIVDAGFLELVRLGIKSPDDPLIVKSLKVIDEQIKVETPNGAGFYRYNHDGYGEMDDGRRWNWDGKYTGKGRLWALLAGERGQYELALVDNRKWKLESNQIIGAIQNPKTVTQNQEFLTRAKTRLDAMLGFAGEGLMIPEQVWDRKETPNADRQFVPELKFGEGTGSATPLAWSMAQFIRLAVNIKEGKNLDTPDIVYNRYVLGKKSEADNKISTAKNKQCEIAQSFVQNDRFLLSTITLNESTNPGFWGKKGASDSTLRLVYFDTADDVEIVGDFTGWKPCGLKLRSVSTRSPNRKVIGLKFPNSARIEYKLIVDGKWIADPLNPNKVDNGVGGENSVLTMPKYQPTKWDADENLLFVPTEGDNRIYSVSVPLVISEIEIDSKIYGKKNVKIFLPDGYESQYRNKTFPTLYFQDGSDYINRAKAIQIQRNLVKAGKVKPFIMVFLDPKDRMKEYWASDDYARFLATEVVPAIDAKYNTIKTRDGRSILGASLGGITSVWVGLKYPEIFSRIGGQSSSFWVDDERVVKELSKLDANKTKYTFYFDDGTLEGVEDTRRVNVMLRGKGYAVTYIEGETGHNWTSWRDRLADAFVALVN